MLLSLLQDAAATAAAAAATPQRMCCCCCCCSWVFTPCSRGSSCDHEPSRTCGPWRAHRAWCCCGAHLRTKHSSTNRGSQHTGQHEAPCMDARAHHTRKICACLTANNTPATWACTQRQPRDSRHRHPSSSSPAALQQPVLTARARWWIALGSGRTLERVHPQPHCCRRRCCGPQVEFPFPFSVPGGILLLLLLTRTYSLPDPVVPHLVRVRSA